MSEVKVFRVSGMIKKPNLQTPFTKEIRALRSDDAAEKVFTELGSKHRAKRYQINIARIEEISREEITNPLIKKLTYGD